MSVKHNSTFETDHPIVQGHGSTEGPIPVKQGPEGRPGALTLKQHLTCLTGPDADGNEERMYASNVAATFAKGAQRRTACGGCRSGSLLIDAW